jgi:hypothetical protein
VKTPIVVLGDKHYEASELTVAELVFVSLVLAKMGKAGAGEGDAFQVLADSIETFVEILLAKLRKVNPEVTSDELRKFTPNEIMLAIGTLIPASCDPAALSGVVMDSYQRHRGD